MSFAKRAGRENNAASEPYDLKFSRPRARMPTATAAGAATRELLAHRTERSPVSCACAKLGERFIVSRNRVALVIRESVAGVTHVEGPHDGVALYFREDRGGGDAGGLGVAFDDGLLRNVDFLQPLRIDQQLLRRQSKPADRMLHSLDARPINIDRVDLLDLGKRHTPTLSLFLYLLREFFAGCRVEFFRVVDPDYARARFQDHGTGGDRTGEDSFRPRPRLPRHNGRFPRVRSRSGASCGALPFGPVFEAAFLD